jgi:hypothetical protein
VKCPCGKTARIVGDVRRDGVTRLVLCSPSCPTVLCPGTVVDVVVEPEDFQRVMRARPCWCHLRHHGSIPWCPAHGEQETDNPKE